MKINMTVLVSALIALALSVTVIGADTNPPKRRTKLSPAERKVVKANIERMMMKKNGGYVIKPGSVKGKIVFANCQSLVPAEKLAIPAYAIHKYLKVNTANTNHAPVNCQTASKALKTLGATAAVFVVECNDAPPMLVAPESKWALVNVTSLNYDKPDENVLHSRVCKEMMRAVAYLCGAVNSNYKGSILSCGSVKQLDSTASDIIPPDVYSRMQSYLPNIDMNPAIISTYRKACEQGWAPAPTNEFQKAIWEEVRSVPKNPMTIKFDPKKGR